MKTVIFAENNFYYTIDEEEISELIIDRNDLDSNDIHFPYTGIINWQPFLTTEVDNAGIN